MAVLLFYLQEHMFATFKSAASYPKTPLRIKQYQLTNWIRVVVFDKNLSVKSVSDRYIFYLFIIHVYAMTRVCHGRISKISGKASKINGFAKRKRVCFTIFERALM